MIPSPENNHQLLKIRHGQNQMGFSLIEVLVSAFVLSISLLGLISMQFTSMKGTQQSYMKQQAMGVIQNTMERMAANRPGVIAGNYILDSNDNDSLNCSNSAPDCTTSSCTVEDIANVDKLSLVCGYKAGSGSRTGAVKIQSASDITAFSGGRLQIACRPDCTLGGVTVTVSWTERAFEAEISQPDLVKLNLRVAAP